MWDGEQRAAAAEARSGARQLTAGGEHWHVYEVTQVYDRRGSPRLVFESEAVVRMVRNFPANWRQLGDAELFELSWHA